MPDPQGIMRALPFLLVGFGCGIFGHGLGELLAKKAAASDPEMARQVEIAQTDERNVMIGIRNGQIDYVPFSKAIKHDKGINRDDIELVRILSM